MEKYQEIVNVCKDYGFIAQGEQWFFVLFGAMLAVCVYICVININLKQNCNNSGN